MRLWRAGIGERTGRPQAVKEWQGLPRLLHHPTKGLKRGSSRKKQPERRCPSPGRNWLITGRWQAEDHYAHQYRDVFGKRVCVLGDPSAHRSQSELSTFDYRRLHRQSSVRWWVDDLRVVVMGVFEVLEPADFTAI